MILWTLGEVVRKPISSEAARIKVIRQPRSGVQLCARLGG